MLRFVLERHEVSMNTGLESRDLVTCDVDIPALERLLKQGGRGENGFERWRLIGVEIDPQTTDGSTK